MAIGSTLGITLPTQGGNTGTWGTDLNLELNKIITAVEAQVPISAIDFSADLAAGDNGITGLSHVTFTNQTAVTALNAAYTKSGDWYFRDGENREIQMTADGNLNNASAGGLGDSGGDYGTNGITFDWDGTIYNAKSGAGADAYANVRMDELQLRDGSGNDLTIDVPAMSTNYTLSLPIAVPASSGTLVQSDTSGNLTFSNTISQDVTLSGNSDFVVAGTGAFKHGDRTMCLGASAGQVLGVSGTNGQFADGEWRADGVGDVFMLAVPLSSGDRITSITYSALGGDGGSKVFSLRQTVISTGVTTQVEAQTGITTTGFYTSTWNLSDVTVAANISLQISFAGNHAGDEFYGIEITYDRP